MYITLYQPDLRGRGRLEKDDDWAEVTLYLAPRNKRLYRRILKMAYLTVI